MRAEDGCGRARGGERVAHGLDDDARAEGGGGLVDEVEAAEQVELAVVVEQPGAVDRELLLRTADAGREAKRSLGPLGDGDPERVAAAVDVAEADGHVETAVPRQDL